MVCLPSTLCTCNPLPAFHLHLRQLCAWFRRQAVVALQSGQRTFPHHGHVPSEATGQRNAQNHPPKVGDFPVQLYGFYLLNCYPLHRLCGAGTEQGGAKPLTVFLMVPFQNRDTWPLVFFQLRRRTCPAEHTEPLWPAPNGRYNKSRPRF